MSAGGRLYLAALGHLHQGLVQLAAQLERRIGRQDQDAGEHADLLAAARRPGHAGDAQQPAVEPHRVDPVGENDRGLSATDVWFLDHAGKLQQARAARYPIVWARDAVWIDGAWRPRDGAA